MAQFYEMPAISPTMERGTIVSWRVREGQPFESGTVVAEVGTDKANMDAEIFESGVLIKHLIAEGDEVPPGFPIAIVGKSKDEDVSALLKAFEERRAAAPSPSAPSSPSPAASEAPSPEPPAPVAPAERPSTASVRRAWHGRDTTALFADTPGDLGFGAENGRVAASPLARKVAADLGVDLRRVPGTGPAGRITRADVEQAPKGPAAPASAARRDETVRNSPMRKTIARRLTESHQQIPTFFLTAALDAQGLVDFRDDLKQKLPDLKFSFNDLLILAVARALRDHPEVNASWGDKEIVRHGRVDIGIAVAMKEGLITPVLRGADGLGLREVADRVRALAGRAREQKLQPDEYVGATFTISNLGMFGIEHFTAIINPPEAAILAVGSIERVAVATDDGFADGWRMKVTMTCDHRVVDGAVGAQFLQTLRTYVESPWLLLV